MKKYFIEKTLMMKEESLRINQGVVDTIIVENDPTSNRVPVAIYELKEVRSVPRLLEAI